MVAANSIRDPASATPVPLITLFALKASPDCAAMNSNNVMGGTLLFEAGCACRASASTSLERNAGRSLDELQHLQRVLLDIFSVTRDPLGGDQECGLFAGSA